MPKVQTFESFENVIIRANPELKYGPVGPHIITCEILSEFKFTPDIWA